MTSPGALGSNPTFQSLQRRVEMLETQVINSRNLALAAADRTPVKRFRIAVFTTALVLGGGLVTANLTWSSPMASEVYNVDVGCSGILGGITATISNQTAEGCTVSFTAPGGLSIGTVCVVLGVAPATS